MKGKQSMGTPDPIRHIVVLMLENHSFDQILGCMQTTYPALAGVDDKNPRTNCDYPDGKTQFAQEVTEATAIPLDPHHEHVNVMRQLANSCGGFVSDFAQSYGKSTPEERKQIMGYYRLGDLPVIHTLAQNFMICDHWFSSLPGPTWPNRFFVHSGTSKGHVKMPAGIYIKDEHCYDQYTIYDELERKQIKWGIYHHGMPQSITLERLWDKFDHFHRIDSFYKDAAGPADGFPQYSFIEPSYGGDDQNDQHPPTDIRKGEVLIARVYNAIKQNDELWKSTLLVLLYDEHGGFYDHVIPPPAEPPDKFVSEYEFDQYGLRVPAVLVSPWVEKNFNNIVFDHTSLLKYLIDKWDLDPNCLGKRTAKASTFVSLLQNLKEARTDSPGIFDLSTLPVAKQIVPCTTNEQQNALISFSHFLEQKMSHVEELAAIGYRSLKSLDGAVAQLSVAKDRFLLFLHHGQEGRLGTDN
jgi:phospholipase C